MKKKRGLKIHLSNRLSYTLIAILILVVAGVGIYAATYSASGAGHPYTELSTCPEGQTLKVVGGVWTCQSSTETDPNVASWAKPSTASPPVGNYKNFYVIVGGTSSPPACASGYVSITSGSACSTDWNPGGLVSPSNVTLVKCAEPNSNLCAYKYSSNNIKEYSSDLLFAIGGSCLGWRGWNFCAS